MEAIDAAIQAAHEREAYAKGTATRILNFLRDLEIDTAAKLAARIARMSERDKVNFINGRSRGQYSTERLQRLLESIQEASIEWRRITEDNIGISAKELAAAELQLQGQVLTIQGVLGEGVALQSVVRAVYSQPLMAKPLREYFKDQEASVRRTITDSIRRSFVAGETVDQTVQSLFGTDALKFTDGDLRKNRNGVRGLARTALNHVSATTTLETFKALGVENWIFSAVADSRTSTICSGLDHTRWKVSNNNAPLPPRHINCRSVALFGDTPIEGTRASNLAAGPGQVDATLSYEELLRRQPVAWQRQQFTRLQWDLWRSGKVKLRGLSDTKGTRELTDGQLRARYSAVISRLENQTRAA